MKKIMSLIGALALTGCTAYSYPSNYAEAEELCKDNNGVMKLDVGPVYFDVYCNNNATFLNMEKKLK